MDLVTYRWGDIMNNSIKYNEIKIDSIRYELDFDLNTVDYLNDLYNLFNNKMNYVTTYLKKNEFNEDEWDVEFIKQDTLEIKDKFIEAFINSNDFIWEMYLDKKLLKLVENYKKKFSIIDHYAKEEELKVGRYFDMLCEMFSNIYSYTEMVYEKYNIKVNELRNEMKQLKDEFNDLINGEEYKTYCGKEIYKFSSKSNCLDTGDCDDFIAA
ncbi:hypothetical protein [Clostridium combesii]|uniref:Uncharacterized protein n=1 Tax=Clostridium combesii TaxID=39481 RepID=A0A2G7HJE0_9CLOT|nr:hypothetical protein [Clostridium combesii]PIH05228.1 hypothetical protein CS538_05205 [Clostridium combesii]